MCISSGMSLSKLEFNTARKSQATFQNVFLWAGNYKKGQGKISHTADFYNKDGQAAAMLQKLKPTRHATG